MTQSKLLPKGIAGVLFTADTEQCCGFNSQRVEQNHVLLVELSKREGARLAISARSDDSARLTGFGELAKFAGFHVPIKFPLRVPQYYPRLALFIKSGVMHKDTFAAHHSKL